MNERLEEGLALFKHRFTIFPDGETTSLHCSTCSRLEPFVMPVGYHPSLDVLITTALRHNREAHA